MVTVLAARWQLGDELYRETGDVDLGIPPIVARDHNLVRRRCLEIAFAAGIGPENFTSGVRAESAELIRSLFNRRNAPMTALTLGRRLSTEAADVRLTRTRALITRVFGEQLSRPVD